MEPTPFAAAHRPCRSQPLPSRNQLPANSEPPVGATDTPENCSNYTIIAHNDPGDAAKTLSLIYWNDIGEGQHVGSACSAHQARQTARRG